MTALFTVWRDGTATSCGRSCYNAKHKACRCPICGGLNHGKGPEAAARITRRHADEWTEAAGPDAEVELDGTVQQDPLFTIGDHPMPDEAAVLASWEEADCSHTCRDGHTHKWGRCAYGIEPAAVLERAEMVPGPDGHPSLVYRPLSADQVAGWLREQGYTVTP